MEPTPTSPPRLGFGYMPEMNTRPDSTTPLQQAEQAQAREKASTFTGTLGAMWRQDGLVDGAMAELAVHNNLLPDESYSSFADPGFEEATKGIWPEFHKELFKAHSPAHRDFIAERLRQKQDDLVRLNDLGFAGNVGRFALGMVSPDQLLMGMAGGWAARGYRMSQTALAARAATSGVGRAAAAAGVRAEQAAASTGGKAIAFGIGFGAAENVAYEAFRQSVNFEDDTAAVLEAGLLGAAFTSPFAIMGARSKDAMRAAQAAHKEHDVLTALKAVDDGQDLTPAQGRLIAEAHKANTVLRDFEAGRLTEADAAQALDSFHGPQEPDDLWMKRLDDRIKEQGRALLDDMFPTRYDVPEAPKPPEAIPKAPKPVTPEAPPKTAMELALERATARRTEKVKQAEAARKQADLVSGFDRVKAENVDLRKKLLGDAWAKADADRAAAKERELSRIAREHDLARMAAEEDPFEAAARAESPEPSVAPAEPAKAPELQTPESFVGQEVSWLNRSGDPVFGTVKGVNEFGRLTVEDIDGKNHSVAHTSLEQYAGETPDGFLGGSIGSGQIAVIESTASQRTALATIKVGDTEVPIRFDRYAHLNGSPVKRVRELAYMLIKDPIQNDKFDAQGMTASEHKKEIHRRLGGKFHLSANLAFDEAAQALDVPMWNLKARSKLTKDFYAWATRALREDPDVAREAGAAFPAVQKATAAMREFYRDMLKEAQAADVKGAEGISPDDLYANRIWDHGGIRDAVAAHGEDSVYRVIADAIKDPEKVIEKFKKSPHYRPDMSDADILTRKAKRFLKAVRSLEFSAALQDAPLVGRDMGTLRDNLKEMKVPDGQIDDLVDLLFEVKAGEGSDTGRMGNLKFRFALDENTKVETKGGTLRLSDLFEGDARVLVDTYGGSMAGHIALAKKGIKSQADWAAELRRAGDEALADAAIDGNRVQSDLKMLQDIHLNITGRPMSTADFSTTARTAAAFRGYTRAVMLPQLGIAAAFEMSKAIAMFGFRSMLHHMPSLRGFMTALRKGYIPDVGLARDIQLMTGFGYEKAASYARLTELENGWANRGLTRFEQLANTASHTVDTISGNASFTSLTKQWSAMGAVQNMADFAHGRRKLSPKLEERWVGQGISVDDQQAVLDAFKQFSDEQGGVLKGIRYEEWQQARPKTYDSFMTFVNRQVRDAIQDHDLGETMPFMDSTLGKMFSELKTFFLVAHAKNFLKNMHYRDMTALHIWGIGFLGECLAYSLQTSVNHPAELEERLTPEKIATAAMFRMSALGTGSLLVETGYALATGGDSLVQPGMTANTDNRSFLNTPSLMVARKLGNVPMTLAGATFGTDTMTRGEFRDVWGAMPGLRFYGLRAAGDYLGSTMPATDPEKVRTGP